jgi:hypothetical protein
LLGMLEEILAVIFKRTELVVMIEYVVVASVTGVRPVPGVAAVSLMGPGGPDTEIVLD